MGLLIKNIKALVQVGDEISDMACGREMSELNTITDAFLLIEDGLIKDYGEMKNCPPDLAGTIDATAKLVLPSFCDSHTHLVYAGSREIEYIDKIRGLSYEDIAKRGGGILNSAKLLHNTSEESLFEQSMYRINEIIKMGTGAVEIKSGYGLNTEDEIKMLRVIRRIKENSPVIVKSTFLGAHSIPAEYKNNQSGYVDIVVNEMIPKVGEEKLADFVDVFCDKGFFTPEETERILIKASEYGMRPKIHANELDFSGGIRAGVKHNALSVDHLEFTGNEEIEILLNSGTMPTLLPGAAFFLGMDFPPARKMITAGLPLALASDYNPGSSPSGNMKFIMSLGCIIMRMIPEEVINATTINSAYAMGVSKIAGSISRGKVANVYLTSNIPNYSYLPYSYGSDLIDTVILNGEIQ